MDSFGSFLKGKRQQKALTLQDLSKLCFRQFGKEIGWCPDAPQLSRWETEKAVPLLKHRPALLAIAKTLGMDDSEKNEFLIKAGLSPLQPEELDVDAMLSKLGSERWRKTHFLSKSLGWSEDKVGKKLGIPFWDVRHDLKEAEKELSLLKEKKTWLSQQQVQHIKSLQEFAKSVIESCPIFYPSFDTPKEIKLFHDAYFSLWKLFHDLVHHAYWPSLAAHLSDGGQKIEHMAAEITIESTCMPWEEPVPVSYELRARVRGAMNLIQSGDLAVVASFGDTKEWQQRGLKPTCPFCPIHTSETIEA